MLVPDVSWTRAGPRYSNIAGQWPSVSKLGIFAVYFPPLSKEAPEACYIQVRVTVEHEGGNTSLVQRVDTKSLFQSSISVANCGNSGLLRSCCKRWWSAIICLIQGPKSEASIRPIKMKGEICTHAATCSPVKVRKYSCSLFDFWDLVQYTRPRRRGFTVGYLFVVNENNRKRKTNKRTEESSCNVHWQFARY